MDSAATSKCAKDGERFATHASLVERIGLPDNLWRTHKLRSDDRKNDSLSKKDAHLGSP